MLHPAALTSPAPGAVAVVGVTVGLPVEAAVGQGAIDPLAMHPAVGQVVVGMGVPTPAEAQTFSVTRMAATALHATAAAT